MATSPGGPPMIPAPTPGGPIQAGGDPVLPEIVTKLQQVSEGFDETNKYLRDFRGRFTDFQTSLTTFLARQAAEQERVRYRYTDGQQYDQLRHEDFMNEAGVSRLALANHWAEHLRALRNTNTHLQDSQEATTRQANAIVRGVDNSTRQAAVIARAANTFDRMANILDRVTHPVQSLSENLTNTVQWWRNWGLHLFVMILFGLIMIGAKYHETQNASSEPVMVDPNISSRTKSMLASNPWWKDLLKDPRPVFADTGNGRGM